MPGVERISLKVGYQAPMIGTELPGNEGKWDVDVRKIQPDSGH